MTVEFSFQGSIFPHWPEACDISFKSRSELFSFHIRQKQLQNDYCLMTKCCYLEDQRHRDPRIGAATAKAVYGAQGGKSAGGEEDTRRFTSFLLQLLVNRQHDPFMPTVCCGGYHVPARKGLEDILLSFGA